MRNCCHSEGKLGKLPMENGYCDVVDGLPKYKRRSVSAVRDFPPGCGRHAPRICSGLKKEAVHVGRVENYGYQERNADAVGDCLIPFRNGIESQHLELLESLDPAETPGQINHVESKVENELNSVIAEPAKMPLLGVTLSNGGDIELLEPLKHEKVNMYKDFHKNITSPRECIVPPKYPSRRRISAVRDFPPFCGRNAARLVHGTKNVRTCTDGKSLGQEKCGTGEELMKQAVKKKVAQAEDNVLKKMGDNVQNEGDQKHQLEMNVFTQCGQIVHSESEGQNSKDRRNQDEFGASSENDTKVIRQDFLEQSTKGLQGRIQNQWELKSRAALKSGRRNIEVLEDVEGLSLESERIVVLGLKAAANGLRMEEERAHEPNRLSASTNERKKKNDLILQEHLEASVKTKKNDKENLGGMYIKEEEEEEEEEEKKKKKKKKKKNSSSGGKDHQGMEMVVWGLEDNLEHGGESDNFQLVSRSHDVDVTLPPSCPISSSGKVDCNYASVTRSKVREILRLFQVVYRKLVKQEEANLKNTKRPDIVAANVLKNKGRLINTGKIIGSVPGVEIGDEFQYRVELNIVGLHRVLQGGIDYVKEGGRVIATSIVASGGYDDDMDDSDVMIYTGSGGNMMKGDKEPEDQKLERGNLALKNSMVAKMPVRVIRGDTRVSESSSAKKRIYVYDGLYLVEQYWQELGPHGKLVFKFRLVRIPGQPELAWKVIKKCKKFKVREGLCVDDISNGKELIPICAVNTIDDEKPPPFEYITHVIYPDWCRPIPPRGCDCTKGCSETRKCPCVAKNGGEIPYNNDGAIVHAKPLVYECSPSCKCPPSCHNRVSQHGIKFQLEIFKTKSRGWGVRSLNSIPSGSFICEYVGELLEEKEAEERMGNDEYLFDIGNNYTDNSLWNGLSNLTSETHSSSCEVVEESCFTIDAAKYGNVGRFINHSCSPNLYAQNILYDHEDKRISHVMLFAVDNIPPLEELTYHYNYAIDQVRDSDGNIRKKSCYCGSMECTGRMY